MTVRPKFETPEDLAIEAEIAVKLEAAWQCQMIKLPFSYKLDWAAVRKNEIVAFLECKRRHRELKEHPTVFFALQKLIAARELHSVTGLPCFYVAQFNDCLAYADVLDFRRKIEFRGRTDRDGKDQEPVSVIPIADWQVVNGGV